MCAAIHSRKTNTARVACPENARHECTKEISTLTVPASTPRGCNLSHKSRTGSAVLPKPGSLRLQADLGRVRFRALGLALTRVEALAFEDLQFVWQFVRKSARQQSIFSSLRRNDIEFYSKFVFHLNGSTRNAYRFDAKVALPDRRRTAIVSIL